MNMHFAVIAVLTVGLVGAGCANNSDTSTTTSLDLSGQGLTRVPSYVFSMTSLEELDLSNNNLTGALPGEIRFLENLRVLDVSDNNMTGVPAEIGQLENLEELDYSKNSLTGLPLELGNLSALQLFNLTGNYPSQQDLGAIKEQLPEAQILY